MREFCGHGIGQVFHEEPQVLHYGPGTLDELVPGMTFTIEPMINAGRREIIRAGRRLDHRHQGPLTVCPVGAHHPRDRHRLRGADGPAGSPPPPAHHQRRHRRVNVATTPVVELRRQFKQGKQG